MATGRRRGPGFRGLDGGQLQAVDEVRRALRVAGPLIGEALNGGPFLIVKTSGLCSVIAIHECIRRESCPGAGGSPRSVLLTVL